MKSHEVDYKIYGDDLQYVQIGLDPDETVVAEAGSMMAMEDGLNFEAKLGDGSEPDKGFFGSLLDVGKRVLTNESIFMTHFTNESSKKKNVYFAAPYPGKIIPVELSELGGKIICQRDAFLCAAKGTKVGLEFNKRLGSGFFGGEGFILQKITGDGRAFLHAGGGIMVRKLQNEKILIDPGCIVAFTKGIQYDIERAGSLKSMIFGGEGIFLATLKGTGYIWLQSLPFSRIAERIGREFHSRGGQTGGRDAISNNIGGVLDIFKE
jgi:uncharacterized protein (TIGR00266 family)